MRRRVATILPSGSLSSPRVVAAALVARHQPRLRDQDGQRGGAQEFGFEPHRHRGQFLAAVGASSTADVAESSIAETRPPCTVP